MLFICMALPAKSRLIWCTVAVCGPLLLVAEEKVDLSVVHRIKSEAFDNSKVMDDMFYLTDVSGPRVTGSPGFNRAADWAVARLKEFGLENIKKEKWGPFGRGWTTTHFEAHLIEPAYAPLIGVPLAWTEGTNGTVTGEPVMAIIRTEADFEKYRGKLRDRVVLSEPLRELEMDTKPLGRRFTSDDLANQALAPNPATFGPRPPGSPENQTPEQRRKFRENLAAFYKQEGALVILSYGYTGDGGTVFATSGGPYEKDKPTSVTAVALTPEHYNRIAR